MTVRNHLMNSARFWQAVLAGGILLYIGLGLMFIVWGRVFADEGWYLYASHQVFTGNIPYQDFAYTQTPLLPYIYGLPQLLTPGIYTGRITSLVFSSANLGLCIVLARRFAGGKTAVLTALLLATFTYGIYFGVIVKTYALLSLLFTLTFVALSSPSPNDARYVWAVICAILAMLVRLSAFVFTIVIIIYCLTKARWWAKSIILVLCGGVIGAALLFARSDLPALHWNLIGHHLNQWGDAGGLDKLLIIFARLLLFTRFFLPHILLAFWMFSIVLINPLLKRKAIAYFRKNPSLAITTAGLLLFIGIHFGTGGFRYDYFVPAIPLLLLILAIGFTKITQNLRASRSKTRQWVTTTLAILIALCLLWTPWRLNIAPAMSALDRSGEPPVEEIRSLAQFIAANTAESDPILALEALEVAVEAQRDMLPGLAMSYFSYEPHMSTQEAQALHLVNDDILLDYITNDSAKVVILTDFDLTLLSPQLNAAIANELAEHYTLAATRPDFGQFALTVYVYLRNN